MGSAIVEAAGQFGYRRLSAAEAEALRGQDNRAVMAAMGVKMWQLPRIAIHMRQVASDRADEITLFAAVGAMLESVAAAGVRVAVVSSNREDVIRRVLGVDLSAAVTDFDCGAAIFGKATKFRRVVRRAEVDPEQAVGVGDEARDIDAARAAGIASAAVTWGYATPALLASRSPTHVVTSVGELESLLTGR
ncbi:Phosphoglycolate phosphatase [Luteitalea pratensis]|uniref:Phosphoglycolate phosphatase n=2 Tax=Luteitalea pratensis TaxID=1855912 RepID=A0A143PNK2_LUTPR|nr:Phosphoglycolate phosphatase [Luteitalea pratensis]